MYNRIKEEIKLEDYNYFLEGNDDERLFAYSEKIRYKKHADKVYIRGIIDISNYCTCKCKFCGNAANNKMYRYRMSNEDVISSIKEVQREGIDIVHLAAGKDQKINFEYLLPIVEYCNNNNICLELAIGIKDITTYQSLINNNVRRFILKFETSNPKLFEYIKECNNTYDEYIRNIERIQELGGSIGTGNIIGLPAQKIDDIVNDLELLKRIEPDMISTSAFIPNKESFFANENRGDGLLALRFLAIANILNINKKVSIPTNSTFGIKNKILAMKIASNVISVNFTNFDCEKNYSIYDGKTRYRADIKQTEEYINNAGMKRVSWREFLGD